MTIVRVLLASNEQLNQAGVRIRYKRLERHLAECGVSLAISAIDDFADPKLLQDDIYLLSKVYDVRSQIVTRAAKDRGKLVGVDLFDDYFSQKTDSRLGRYRAWLATNLRHADFVLMASEVMRESIANYVKDLPVHIIDDPSEPINAEELSSLAQQKIDQALVDRHLNLIWFGIGDNPRFPVGLSDLVAFSDQLAVFRDCRFDVTFDILTNRRAMTRDNMAALKRLPLPHRLREWSENLEAEVLAQSHVCFIPVNAQPFSIVKSLNRAVSALASGNQVLSAGYPLYAALDAFVYRDPERLIRDFAAGTPLLRSSLAEDLVRTLSQRASPQREAAALADFLSSLIQKNRKRAAVAQSRAKLQSGEERVEIPSRLKALLHRVLNRDPETAGGRTFRHGIVHCVESPDRFFKFSKKARVLSASAPFQASKNKYDVRFEPNSYFGELSVLISKNALKHLDEKYRSQLESIRRLGGTRCYRITSSQLGGGVGLPHQGSTFVQLMVYRDLTADMVRMLACLFPRVDWILSEHSKLPFYFRNEAAAEKPEVE